MPTSDIKKGPLYVDSTNNRVGVGTTSPSAKLHLGGTAPLDSIIRQDSTVSGTNWEIGERAAGKWQIFEDDNDTVVATFQSSGNVGIGTSSPSSFYSGANNFVVGSGSGANGMSIFSGTTDAGRLYFADGTSGAARYAGYVEYGHSDNKMLFGTNGLTQAVIDSSGRVGIGTTSPTGNANGSALVLEVHSSGANPPEILAGGQNAEISIAGGSAASYLWSTGAYPLIMATNATERMRIDSSGNLLLGTTSAISSGLYSSSFYGATQNGIVLKTTLSSNGTDFIRFINSSGSVIGEIEQNSASTVAYLTSSDYRLKTAVNYDWDATTRLKQLRPARFEWIADGDDAVPVDGFLAHEVQSVVPEAISGTHNEVDDDGNPVYQGIDQSKLTPLLTKALIEAVEKIEQLETRLAALEAN